MKRMKKIASLLLALVMVFAMTVTAFAANDGKITITNPVKGQEYSIYQIFELESYNKDSGAYAYKITGTWEGFANTEAAKEYISVDTQGYVTWVGDNTEARAAEFAKLALAYAKANSITANETKSLAEDAAEGAKIEFSNLPLGYYLLDSSLGTLCSLNTTANEVEITEKNEEPTNVKTVEEDSTGLYGPTDDADIGQTVNFQSTITAYEGAQSYVFHDKMDAGLTFDGADSVTVTLDGTKVADGNYTINTPATDGDTFDVVFTQAFCDTLKDDNKIVISYSATLNENAVIAGDGNKNESKLSYGENGRSETVPSETKTYTWKVDVLKYTNRDGVETPLADAVFTLSKNADGTNPINFVATAGNTYKACTKETCTHESHVTEITTDATGKFTLEGLDADTYYLTETAAPAGYNVLAAPVKIEIGENGAIKQDGTSISGDVKVENNTGAVLPSTGGIGTTIFYVLGSILVLGAVITLVTKKRMSAE